MYSIVKLTSGETVIGEVVNEDENNVSILDPLMLEIGEGETGNPMMIAMTWIPLTKPTNLVNLKTQHVIAVAETDEEVARYYQKSLAVLKGDAKKLRELLDEEEGEELEWDDEEPKVIKFPVKSANTVH